MISDKINAVDLEISSTCNAACPVCIRRDHGVLADFKQQMRTLEDVKRIFEGTAQNLEKLTLCGNYGDPMTCAEIVPICEYFKEQNKYVHISLSTNGGIGSPSQYQRLGELGVNMIFGVDGASTKTLQLYRVNVNYERVIENITAYMSKIAKTSDNRWTQMLPQWQYLLFEENKRDLLPALKTAKKLGIKMFNIRRPNGFSNPDYPIVPVYDFDTSKFTHWLTEVDNQEIPNHIFGWHYIGGRNRQDKDPDTYDRIYRRVTELKFIDKEKTEKEPPMPYDIMWRTNIAYTGVEQYKEELPDHMVNVINSVNNQECFSLNNLDHSNLQEEHLNVFVSFDNYVYPCCMIGSAVSRSKQRGYNIPEHFKGVLNDVTKNKYERFSVKENSLKDVLNSGILHLAYYNKIKKDKATSFCKVTCGKCSDSKTQYSVV